MSKSKSPFLHLLIAGSGVFLSLFTLWMFNQNYLSSFSLPLRVILMLVTQWLLFLVPGILMKMNKETLADIGFSREKIPQQIGIGVLLALSLSLLFTVIPILLGFKDMVGSTVYTKTWKFVFEFVYAVFGVALVEEMIFRGYIFQKLLAVKDSKSFAIIISSLLFGLFHIFNGNILQIIMTMLLGVLFCLFREKIKGCTLLSLIFCHGVHNFLIVLWVSVL